MRAAATAIEAGEDYSVVAEKDTEIARLRQQAAVWRSKYNASISQQANTGTLEQLMYDYARAMPVPKLRSDSRVKRVGKTEETAVLLLSDLHVGEFVSLDAMHGLNGYDISIFMARIEEVYQKLISIFIDHLTGYRFPELRIYLLGDLINGQFGAMHDELIVTQAANLMETVWGTTYVLEQFILRCLEHFEKVRVCAAPGNHGRMTKKPWAKDADMNWDIVIPQNLAWGFRKEPRVEFKIPKGFFFLDDINGQTFCGFHGHQVKGWAGIPWYGINRFVNSLNEAMNIVGKPFDHVVMGHFHSEAQFARPRGRVIASDCMKGADEYSLSAGFLPSPAGQTMFGVHPEHGVTHIWPLNLQSAYEPKGAFEWWPDGTLVTA